MRTPTSESHLPRKTAPTNLFPFPCKATLLRKHLTNFLSSREYIGQGAPTLAAALISALRQPLLSLQIINPVVRPVPAVSSVRHLGGRGKSLLWGFQETREGRRSAAVTSTAPLRVRNSNTTIPARCAMGEGALPPLSQPPSTGESVVDAPARARLQPGHSQFFIHSTGSTTAAATIFPGLVAAEARICRKGEKGQR